MELKNVLFRKENGRGYITINRPDKLNALNRETISELSETFKRADADREIGCIILTGSGDKAFVAGADISEFASFSAQQGKDLSREGHEKLFNLVENLNTPVIAAVNGFALGGGLELAMSSHLRVASENAKMGLPEVSLGVIPGYGGTQRLAQLVGKGRALEMMMTAQMISAADAYRTGLVNYVVPQAELMLKCEEIGGKILKNSGTAIAAAIRACNAGFTDGVNGYLIEIEEFGNSFETADFREGTAAFLEKRKPAFR